MIDFHSHVLHEVDDGSKSLSMSLEMLKFSEAEGMNYICATSHYIPEEAYINREEYERKFNELKLAASNENIKVNLVPGLEVYMHPSLPALYKEGKIWGINYGRCMLIELPMQQFPIYTEDVLYELRLQGVIPIIAHPERNLAIRNDYKLLEKLVEQGVLAQVNAPSLRGSLGRDIKAFAERLIEHNLIHLIGSDAHNETRRAPKMKDALEALKAVNSDLYEWMLINQHYILEGKVVEVLPIRNFKKKFSLFSFFK